MAAALHALCSPDGNASECWDSLLYAAMFVEMAKWMKERHVMTVTNNLLMDAVNTA
jgi:hypothetical protein